MAASKSRKEKRAKKLRGKEKKMEKNDKIIHIGAKAAGNLNQTSSAEKLLEKIKTPIETETYTLTTEDVMDQITNGMIIAACRTAATNQLLDAAEWMSKKMGFKWNEWHIDGRHFAKCYMSNDAWDFTEEDGIIKLDRMPGIQFIRNAGKEQYKLQLMLMECDMDKLMSEEDSDDHAVSLGCFCTKTNTDGQMWNFDTDSNTWIKVEDDNDDRTDAEMEKLKHFCDQEGISFRMVMALSDLCMIDDVNDMTALAKHHKALLTLGKTLEDSMDVDIAVFKDGKVLPILIPANPDHAGTAVCVGGDDYILCQHADSVVVDREDKSHLDTKWLNTYINQEKPQQTEDLYLKDVYRTKNPDEIIPVLNRLTNRYANTFQYVVPLSKDAFAVSDTAENLGKYAKIYKESGKLTEKEQALLQSAAIGLMRAVACSRIETLTNCEDDEYEDM